MNKVTAIKILKSQKQKYADAEHKIYVANQTVDFIENFLGKDSSHYNMIKSFCLPNSTPDTSDEFYNIKLKNTVRRFQVCVDEAIDTIKKIGLIKKENSSSPLNNPIYNRQRNASKEETYLKKGYHLNVILVILGVLSIIAIIVIAILQAR